MIPLHQLVTADYSPEHTVSCYPRRTWAELQGIMAGIVSQLAVPSERPWLLALDSTFHFAAALLACWHRGITPIVAPDTQPGTLQELQSVIAGLITDRQMSETGIRTVHPIMADSPVVWTARAPQDRALELFTSGSTGKRKRIPKTFGQLANELATLHAQWGKELQGAPRFATVSHLHIYGLLFKLLWPLSSGEAFLDHSGLYWEEILRQLPDEAAVIISSPTHLVHLPQAAKPYRRDWQNIVIFSSGGPLAREAALRIAEVCGRAPIEVLGTTETGGIAFRQQTPSLDWPWQVLPGVDIRVQDGLLEVRSPFLPEPTAWVRTGDRAESVSPQHFHLRGRADQIVKLSEKRLSLTAMENQLLRHEAVEEARLILLPSQSQDERSRLAAVIVPSQQGQRWLEETGTFALISKLRNYLVHDFELVTLPRLWRFPEALPSNAQGKVTVEHLVALFQEPPPDQPTGPILLAQEDTDTGRILHCRVPENLYYLSGHFPQVAVVPGVCQLRWVLQSIETYAGHALQMTAMEAVKFHHMLFPGQAFSLAIRFDGAASTWFYRIFSDEQTFASGRLRVTP